MLKKFTNKKGFTLMEMLIVVAIIAVLVAIAIPTFASQLNKARVSTDEANIRSGYADVMLKILTAETDIADNTKYGLQKDGTTVKLDGTTTTGSYETKGKPEGNFEIAGETVTKWDAVGKHVTYTVNKGKVTIEVK